MTLPSPRPPTARSAMRARAALYDNYPFRHRPAADRRPRLSDEVPALNGRREALPGGWHLGWRSPAGRGGNGEGRCRRAGVIRSGGVPLRDCLGGGGAVAGERVAGLERVELEAEAGVQRRRQRGQRSQREVLPAAQDLANPPGGYAHPGREVGSGQTALAQAPVDLVGELSDEGEHLLVDLGFRGPLIGRNA